MEEAKDKVFSLPSNYVTLQQLKERRLKEQQQKQREKEEEGERRRLEEQRLKEEREKEEEEEEERLRLQIIKESQIIKVGGTSFAEGRPYRINHKKNLQKIYVRKEKEDHPALKRRETEIVVAVGAEIPDQDENLEGMKEKKKKKKKKGKKNKNRKSKAEAEETLIGELEMMPPLENNPEEIMPEVPQEKSAGKMDTRNGFRRRDKRPETEQVEVSINPTVEIESEVQPGKANGKLNTRNGYRQREKSSASEPAEVSINPTVEIEHKVPHEKAAGTMSTRNGFQRLEKRTPSESVDISMNSTVEIDPEVPREKADGKMNTRNRFRRREKWPSSEPVEILTNPTVDIERKIGDLTVGDDNKISTTEKYVGYSKMKNPRRLGYRREPIDASHVWVRKDEKQTDGISGVLPFRR